MRYPLALVLKQPLAILPLGLLATFVVTAGADPLDVPNDSLTFFLEVLESVIIFGLETVVLGRSFSEVRFRHFQTCLLVVVLCTGCFSLDFWKNATVSIFAHADTVARVLNTYFRTRPMRRLRR